MFIVLCVLISFVFAIAYVSWVGGGSQTGTFLIGGQKDSHGCLIAAGYSWCASKQKCLRNWEENCYAAEEEAIRTIYGLQTKRPLSEIKVTIQILEGDKARGSVLFGKPGQGEGGNFLAVKLGDKWSLVYSGNGNPTNCADLAKYNFPAKMIDDLCKF